MSSAMKWIDRSLPVLAAHQSESRHSSLFIHGCAFLEMAKHSAVTN